MEKDRHCFIFDEGNHVYGNFHGACESLGSFGDEWVNKRIKRQLGFKTTYMRDEEMNETISEYFRLVGFDEYSIRVESLILDSIWFRGCGIIYTWYIKSFTADKDRPETPVEGNVLVGGFSTDINYITNVYKSILEINKGSYVQIQKKLFDDSYTYSQFMKLLNYSSIPQGIFQCQILKCH